MSRRVKLLLINYSMALLANAFIESQLQETQHGLNALERKLAQTQTFSAEHFLLGGAQAVRRLMGHAQFGARVVYGDCILFTISPKRTLFKFDSAPF